MEEAWDGNEEVAEWKDLWLARQTSTLLAAGCSKGPGGSCHALLNSSTRCPETRQWKLDPGGCQNRNPVLLPTNQNAIQSPLGLGFPPEEGGTHN